MDIIRFDYLHRCLLLRYYIILHNYSGTRMSIERTTGFLILHIIYLIIYITLLLILNNSPSLNPSN